MTKKDYTFDPNQPLVLKTSQSAFQSAPQIEGPVPRNLETQLADNRLSTIQRTALIQTVSRNWGNRHVQRLIQSERVARATDAHHDGAFNVRRYESGEHAQFGAKQGEVETIVDVNGVKFTYGEMIAMGDLFKDPADMYKSTAAELNKIKLLIQQDRQHFLGVAGVAAVTNKEWADATGGRYTELAADNTSHFAVSNMERWEDLHRKAIKLAKKGDANKAMQTNSFADHFLTDSFSAGHMIKKKDVMDRASSNLPFNDVFGNTLETFATQVANKVLADSSVAAKLSPYEGKRNILGYTFYPMNGETMMNIIKILRHAKSDYVLSMFAKLVHDRLNNDRKADGKGGGTGGIEVTNSHGDTWSMSGDGTLAASPETLKIGQQAVAQSRRNIENAQADKNYDADKAVAFVQVYVPRPTAAGQKKIDEATTTLTDPAQQATIDGFAAVAVENIDLMIAEFVKSGIIRLKVVPTAAAPVPAGMDLAPRPGFKM